MITPMQAADAINYLFAAQAISVVDKQDVVWADYINAEAPDAQPTDLLPACRQAIHDWAASGRSWRIDVGRFVDAIRKLRRQRVVDATNGHALVAEGIDDPMVELDWRRAATRALMDGLPRADAETAAWRAINMTPPPQVEAAHRDVDRLTSQIGERA